MIENKLEKEIEAVLFYKNEPVSLKEFCTIFSLEESVILLALDNLEKSLMNRGVSVVENNKEYSLVTSSDTADIIERIVKNEINKDLSSASLETLSIVAYKGEVTKKEIEYIRGVNSSYSIRVLLMRGLIERESSRLDERIFLYKPTTDLLLHLGIKSIDELPEWNSVQKEIKDIQINNEDILDKINKDD